MIIVLETNIGLFESGRFTQVCRAGGLHKMHSILLNIERVYVLGELYLRHGCTQFLKLLYNYIVQ